MDYLQKEFSKCKSPSECANTYALLKNWSGAFKHFNTRLIQLQKAGHRLVKRSDGQPPSGVSEWYSLRTLSRKRSRKFLMSTEDLEFTIKPVKVSGLQNILPYMMLLFNDMFQSITKALGRNSNVQMVFENDQLREPIIIKTMSSKSLTADIFFNNLTKVLQSYQDFNLRDRTVIRVTKFDRPKEGGGYTHRRGHIAVPEFLNQKRSVVTVLSDGLCFGRALAVGKAFADGLPKRNSKLWQKLRAFKPCRDNYYQKEEALALFRGAEVEPGPVSIDQIRGFSRFLPGYKIQVWGDLTPKDCLYKGKGDGKEINLCLYENHYWVITKMTTFFGKRVQCPHCDQYLKSTAPEHHNCRGRCNVCRRKSSQCLKELPVSRKCPDCSRSFWNDECFTAHQRCNVKGASLCSMYSVCLDCKVSIQQRDRPSGPVSLLPLLLPYN